MKLAKPRGVDGTGDGFGVDLPHLAADHTYLMYVVLVIKARLVLGLTDETVACHETRLYEQSHSVIECCHRYGEVPSLQFISQLVKAEMAIHGIDCLQNGIALRGLPQPVYL